jgi:hypothetical protein
MKREVIRVEPLSSYPERWKAPASPVAPANLSIDVVTRWHLRSAGRR